MRTTLFTTLLLTLIAITTGVRALDASQVDAIARAADAFAELAKNAHITGKPPRQSDPNAKPLLDLVFNTAEIERGRPTPFSQLELLNRWNLAALKVGQIYMLAGTGATDIAAAANDPNAVEKVDRNTAEFAQELGRYFDAQLRLQGAVIDTVQEFVKTASRAQIDNPKVKSGLGQIRSGFVRSVNGVLTTLLVKDLTDEWRFARLAVLIAVAPRTVKFLLPEEAGSVRTTAQEVAEQMQDAKLKGWLATLAGAMAPR